MSKNILLVEYDETFINLFKDLFAAPAFEISVAHDGEVAKRLLSSRHFDLMVTAAMLPRFHGFNLSLSVANEYPDIKIIIISGIYKGLDYRHQAITQYKAHDFFEKPIDGDKLKKRVSELLGLDESATQRSDRSVATTQIPVFDTAKMPAFQNMEEDKLSSDDIFGDIIKRAEKADQYEIKLDEPFPETPQPADKPADKPVAKPTAKPVAKPSAPAVEKIMELNAEDEVKPEWTRTAEDFKPAAIDAHFEPLLTEKKKVVDDNKMKRIEDEISRKLEETLSGLGLGVERKSKPPAKPATPAPPAPTVEVKVEAVSRPPAKEPPRPVIKPPSPPPSEAKRTVIPPVAPKEIHIDRPTQPPPAPRAAEAPANEVGDYQILGLIARGGMAEIYKAKKKGVKGFEKVIAIKKILPGYVEDDKFIEMLVDEAKIAAELTHPNIVQIYDLGRQDNYYFIAMEYVLGKDLREILRKLGEAQLLFPEELSIFIVTRVLEALNYAHKAKTSVGGSMEIVHRDVSPPNILISYRGEVKLADFGVSKASIKMHQTVSGALKGKILYMSPEQARGESSIDHRSDLYSAGVILFELITGKKLFMDPSEMGVLKKVQNGEIIKPSLLKKDIDPKLEAIILKALHRDRGARYQNAADMINDLEAYLWDKFGYHPGSIHLTHFIYNLFKEDIVREGIKVDLKPIPPIAPKKEEKAKAPMAPPVVPLSEEVLEITFEERIPEPAPVVEVKREPPPEVKKKEPFEIRREPHPAPKAPVPEVKKEAKAVVAPEPLLTVTAEAARTPIFQEMAEPKKKSRVWIWAAVLAVVAVAAALYFLILNKPKTTKVSEPATVGQTAGQKETAPETKAPETTTAPVVDQAALLEAERVKQEEAAKQLQAENERQKQLLEEKKKKEEQDRLKKAEDDRRIQEEADRLRKAEEERLRKEEQERLNLAAAEEEKRKAEDARKKLEEANRVKEGDVVPLAQVDVQPAPLSTPNPVVPSNVQPFIRGGLTVRANILIDHSGNVETVRLLPKTNWEQLNQVLETTIKSWKYKPAMKGNLRVKVWKAIQLLIK